MGAAGRGLVRVAGAGRSVGGRVAQVRNQLAALYVLAARFQPVRVLCPQSAQADLQARMAQAGDASRVRLYDYETDDVWCRDYGPLVSSQRRRLRAVCRRLDLQRMGQQISAAAQRQPRACVDRRAVGAAPLCVRYGARGRGD